MDFKGAAQWLSQMQLEKAAQRGLYSAALRGVNEIVTFIIPSRSPQPVDRGLYRSGWRATKTKNGATIENSEPHAVYIEDGVKNVRIGPAAFRAIAEWCVRKGLAGPSNALDVAARVIWAMRRRGYIFGRQGMGILRELREQRLPAIIEEEVGREIHRAALRSARSHTK